MSRHDQSQSRADTRKSSKCYASVSQNFFKVKLNIKVPEIPYVIYPSEQTISFKGLYKSSSYFAWLKLNTGQNLEMDLKGQQSCNTCKILNAMVAKPNLKEEISRFKAKDMNTPTSKQHSNCS